MGLTTVKRLGSPRGTCAVALWVKKELASFSLYVSLFILAFKNVPFSNGLEASP